MILFGFVEPEQMYVIKLYATNSKGNGIDVQMQVRTLAGSGRITILFLPSFSQKRIANQRSKSTNIQYSYVDGKVVEN